MTKPKQPTAEQNRFGVAKGQLWLDRTEPGPPALFVVNRITFSRKLSEWIAEGTRGIGRMSGRETHKQLDGFGQWQNVTEQVAAFVAGLKPTVTVTVTGHRIVGDSEVPIKPTDMELNVEAVAPFVAAAVE